MRSVLALFIPLVAMTSQNSAAGTVIPPFLDALHYPVSLIGSLVSVSPFFSLAARIPAGLIYRGERARRLIAVLLSVTIVCNLAYGYAVHPLLFGIVHGANGFASGAATTVYLALFVESLPSGADRSHAIGYYAGCMAVGFSSGSFMGGFIADRWGYPATFQFAALLAGFALAAFLVLTSRIEARVGAGAGRAEYRQGPALKSLKIILEPKMATIAVVALFLNMLHQMGTAFFPLYGLAVGLGMTQVGSVRGLYALCNAVTRPLTGFVVKRLGARRLAYAGLPLECAVVMLVPFFQEFAPLAVIFVIAGLRAACITSTF